MISVGLSNYFWQCLNVIEIKRRIPFWMSWTVWWRCFSTVWKLFFFNNTHFFGELFFFFLHVVKQPNSKTSPWSWDTFEESLFQQPRCWLTFDLLEHHTKQCSGSPTNLSGLFKLSKHTPYLFQTESIHANSLKPPRHNVMLWKEHM